MRFASAYASAWSKRAESALRPISNTGMDALDIDSGRITGKPEVMPETERLQLSVGVSCPHVLLMVCAKCGYLLVPSGGLGLTKDEAVEDAIVPGKQLEAGRVMLQLADNFGQSGDGTECHWAATAG